MKVRIEMQMIEVKKIRRDGGTQSRAGMNGPVVYEYAELMAQKVEFPSIVVFHDGQDYWLADGFHRVAAAEEAKLPTIKANVLQGTQRDAVLYSVGANSDHGLRRTNDDKRKAVMTLLQDEEWRQWSDRAIARRCGVDHKTVAAWREHTGGEIPQVSERRGADGKTYTVKHWGADHPMAFWDKVKWCRLDKDTILEILQPGATTLTDLKMSKADCLLRLEQLATERTAALFPVGSIVQHTTGRFGEVLQAYPLTLRMMDFRVNAENVWNMWDCTLSTREAYEASLPPIITEEDDESPAPETYNGFPAYPTKSTPTGPETFYEGDIVTTPTGHEGTVTGATGRLVTVQTINGKRDYNRAFLTLVRRAEPAEQTPVEDEYPDLPDTQQRYEEISESFARIFEYSEEQIIATPQLLQDIRNAMDWLSEVEEQLESELVEVKVAI